jgi:hypothetical protein
MHRGSVGRSRKGSPGRCVYTYALLMDERWASAVTGTLNRSSSAAEVLVNGAQAEREVR